jgi:hypothetical protein
VPVSLFEFYPQSLDPRRDQPGPEIRSMIRCLTKRAGISSVCSTNLIVSSSVPCQNDPGSPQRNLRSSLQTFLNFTAQEVRSNPLRVEYRSLDGRAAGAVPHSGWFGSLRLWESTHEVLLSVQKSPGGLVGDAGELPEGSL